MLIRATRPFSSHLGEESGILGLSFGVGDPNLRVNWLAQLAIEAVISISTFAPRAGI